MSQKSDWSESRRPMPLFDGQGPERDATQEPTYFNTPGDTGEALKAAQRAAGRQQDAVLAYFRAHQDGGYTPDDIWRTVLPDAPVTSARRAVTNLTTAGLLVKTAEQRIGPWGRREFVWRLA